MTPLYHFINESTKRLMVALCCFGLTPVLHAAEFLPAGCVPIVVEQLIQFPADKPGLMMIHNLSTTTIWLIPETPPTDPDANWNSALARGHWSALNLDNNSLALHCIESKPGHEQEIPCGERIAVCQWIPSAHPDKPKGIFWAGENQALTPLIAYLGRQGFILPSSPQSVLD
jgi:hypothetical protein